MSKTTQLCAFSLLFLMQLPQLYAEKSNTAKEYDIKAAYLVNLGHFVYWPESAFPAPDTPFFICTLGTNPFAGALEFLQTQHKKIQEREIKINYLHHIDELKQCHILFISDSENLRLSDVFDAVNQQPILLVSDIKNFVVLGGMVQFYRSGTHIRLMINPEALAHADLRPNAQLMRVAKSVKP